MKDRSDNREAVAVIAVILLLLLLLMGGGAYYVYERQRNATILQVERARVAEAQARTEVEHARAEYAKTVRIPSVSRDYSGIQAEGVRSAIESVLRTQESAWNRGDLDAFMDGYWKSDDLTFSSGGKTTRGWTATLERYRARYSTAEQMGRLSFGELEVTPLGDSAALVLGQWKLERENEPLSGNFSIIFRKFDDRWLIVHDHTSRSTE